MRRNRWGPSTRPAGVSLALVSVALQGCVILPVPTPEHGLLSGRGEITEADVAFLEAGKTTREELLLRFGEPSTSLNDERILVYHWQAVRGYVLVAVGGRGGGDADAWPVPKDYLVLVEFDEHGRLRRSERTAAGLFESTAERVDKWTPPGSVKLGDVRRAAGPGRTAARGRFVIDPVPGPDSRPGNALAAIPSLRVKIEEFANDRASRLIGQRKAAFGVVTHDVYTLRPLGDVVRDAVASQWKAAGHRLVEDDPDATVTGRIVQFEIETPVFPSWDAVGRLDVIIVVRAARHAVEPITRRYHCQRVEKTILGPSEKDFEVVIVSCLQDVMYQMASDVDLVRHVPGERVGQ